jgi:DNA polymerase eta
MCPNLVVVHVATYKDGENEAKYHLNPDNKNFKVSLDLYRRESVKIINIFKAILPTAEVGMNNNFILACGRRNLYYGIEKASVDEAFVDFTVPVQQILIERYPELAAPSPNSPYGMDSSLPPPPQSLSWHPSCVLVPSAEEDNQDSSDAPAADEKDIEDKILPEGGKVEKSKQPVTWQDVALSIGGELLFKARNEILQNLGYTTSAVST